jgi:hypothetical protein
MFKRISAWRQILPVTLKLAKSTSCQGWEQQLSILREVLAQTPSRQSAWKNFMVTQYLENELCANPQFRFVPNSTKLFTAALANRDPNSAVIRTLLNHIDPTDGQSYASLELAGRMSHWNIVRQFARHPAVQTEEAFDIISARCNGSAKNNTKNLLINLKSIFNA